MFLVHAREIEKNPETREHHFYSISERPANQNSSILLFLIADASTTDSPAIQIIHAYSQPSSSVTDSSELATPHPGKTSAAPQAVAPSSSTPSDADGSNVSIALQPAITSAVSQSDQSSVDDHGAEPQRPMAGEKTRGRAIDFMPTVVNGQPAIFVTAPPATAAASAKGKSMKDLTDVSMDDLEEAENDSNDKSTTEKCSSVSVLHSIFLSI